MSKVIKRGYSYGLSKSRYLELRYFCLQYGDKRNMVIKHAYINGVGTNEKVQTSNLSDETAKQAIKLVRLKDEIDMIEESAKEAAGVLSDYILESVTKDISYGYLAVPCGERQFYDMKRLFFRVLDEKRG